MTNSNTSSATAPRDTRKRLGEAAVRSLWWQVSEGVLSVTDPARLRDAEESAADVPWLIAEVERLSGVGDT